MFKQFHISEQSQLERVIKRLSKYVGDGKTLTITAEPYKKKRSIDQNKRYWVLLNQVSQQMPDHMDGQWFAPEAWHDYCKRRFLGVEPGPAGPYPKTTRTLTTTEFSGLCDELMAHFIDQGVMFDEVV